MLNIKDYHNDELFRRAAENYPLKTDSADWEALRTKLDAAPYEPQSGPVEKRRKYRFLWLLLLLIPFGIIKSKYKFIGNQFNSEHTGSKTTATVQESTANVPVSTKGTINGSKNNISNTTTGNVVSTGTISADGSPNNNQATSSSTENNNLAAKKIIDEAVKNNDITNIDIDLHSTNKHKGETKQRSKIRITNTSATDDDEQFQKRHVVKSDKRKQQMNSKAGETTADEVSNELVVAAGEVKKVNEVDEVEKNSQDEKVIEKIKNDDDVEKKNDAIGEKKSKTEISKTKIENKEYKKKKKSNKHFYVGLMAGPDFSMVKLQSIKKTGIGYGLLAGYKINKRFSLETGFYKDRKFYSSNGQYFSTKNIYLPPNASIEYVDGECNMWELPLNLTYNFRQRSNSAWFASIGVSSYFMTNESYTYDVLRNGYRYPYSREYKNKSTSLLAVVNIGAGFTYQLGKIANLRIEPYFKLPVNKLGTGNLPIQSAGVMLGITKTIF
ncbi:hypothetical protein BH11BAC4_BH11BAC4_07100 [soil metagenome]